MLRVWYPYDIFHVEMTVPDDGLHIFDHPEDMVAFDQLLVDAGIDTSTVLHWEVDNNTITICVGN